MTDDVSEIQEKDSDDEIAPRGVDVEIPAVVLLADMRQASLSDVAR